MRTIILACFTAIIVSFSTAAYAQNVDAKDPREIVQLLQEMGYQAKLSTSANDNPRIESSASGKAFYIYFVGCENDADCKAINFSTYWIFDEKVSMERVNSWNLEKFVGKAFLDQDRDVFLQFFVNLDVGGVDRSNFEDTFDWWQLALSQFEEYVKQ